MRKNNQRWVHYRRFYGTSCLCGKETPIDIITSKTFDYFQVTRRVEDITCPRCMHEIIITMETALDSVADLIAESDGVSGLHLNGDIATWDELSNEWLSDFNKGIAL